MFFIAYDQCRYFCITQTTVERQHNVCFFQYVDHINEWNNYTSFKWKSRLR